MKTITTVTERVTHTYDSTTDTTETSTSSSEQKTVLVSFDELNDTQREQAYEMWRESEVNDPYFGEWTSAELFDTVKAFIAQTGYSMTDWSLGSEAYRSFVRLSYTDADDLQGKRALAWWENVVIGPLRIPWTGPKRWELARFGFYYRPGMVKPCPLTGVYYDADLLDYVKEQLVTGSTVRDAVLSVSDWYAHTLEVEQEWALSETAFEDESNGVGREWEISEDGTVLGMV